MNEKYLSRLVDKEINDYLSVCGALSIEGPKWCGKTWTSEFHSKSCVYIASPEQNHQNREMAKINPSLLLQGDTPRLIDEWQEVPSLWDAVRSEVDSRAKVGQFILTGSTKPLREDYFHSGAGRIATIKMGTMSLFESGDSSGKVSLKSLFDGSFQPDVSDNISLEKLAYFCVRGGWPGNLISNEHNCSIMPLQYIDKFLNDDALSFRNFKVNKARLELLLKSLARNESTCATVSTLKDDTKMDEETINRYLEVLEYLYIIENQRPFHPNVRSSVRIKQGVKRHFTDPSLTCALLGYDVEGLINDLQTFGFIFEALCERDLRIYSSSLGASFYHYQDYKNHEIDAVVELKSGQWGAFEIKLGANKIDEAAQNLLKIEKDFNNDSLSKKPQFLCVICGLTNYSYRRTDGVYVVPITALRP
ncbi:MAG: ATP-binding protein [Sphaerochaetaceae bacterium]|nr:ATP-binding protein [Sphaerochaetaceae bacterium]